MRNIRPVAVEGDLFLKCPKCDGTYLHHGMVTVYEREGGEDGPSRQTTVNAPAAHVTFSNPSARRGGLRIRFVCEGCPNGGDGWAEIADLCVTQHKGQTHIFWEMLP